MNKITIEFNVDKMKELSNDIAQSLDYEHKWFISENIDRFIDFFLENKKDYLEIKIE